MTSAAAWCACHRRGEDPVVAEIEQRIAEWTHLPPEHGEPIQVLPTRQSGTAQDSSMSRQLHHSPTACNTDDARLHPRLCCTLRC